LLLADDHAETGALLRRLLQPDFEIVALVSDGRSLIDAAARLAPDAIVSDVSMPIVDGLGATAEILHDNPDARVVLVTVHGDPILVERGLSLGALGYVLKASAGDDLIPAIRAALRGERLVSKTLQLSDLY
jgi:DNA-binding NarL/FixJ family response regulator